MTLITRRQAVMATLAGLAAARRARAQNVPAGIDQTLRAAVASGKAPGIVAVAATDKGPVYAGAFGKRNVETGPDMTLELGVLDRLHDQGGHDHRGHADG